MNLARHIESLIEKHGGLRAAARALRVDPSYLSRIKDGAKPSRGALQKLGVQQVVVYRRAA